MRHLNRTTLLSFVFLFAMSGSMVQGAVPGALIEFIADEANFVNGDWINSGVAAKKLKGGKKAGLATPVFEPAAGDEPARFTGTEKGQYFGGNIAINPIVKLQNWTLEVILKRNGPAFGGEHHVLGLHNAGHAGGTWGHPHQWIMLGFTEKDTGKMFIGLKAGDEPLEGPNGVTKAYENLVDIGVNRWHHISFTYNNVRNQLESWIDGLPKKKVTARHDFTDKDMNYHIVFAGAKESQRGIAEVEQKGQTFNGSIQLVRVYDRVLTNNEIQVNLSVGPAAKLTTTWGSVKTQYAR